MSGLLIDEPALVILPSLVRPIGLKGAIVVQQLHFLLSGEKNGQRHKGQKWIYNTYKEWKNQFANLWSEKTIERTFTTLESLGLVRSCQPEGRRSRRKWYRLDYEQIGKLLKSDNVMSEEDTSASSNRPTCPLPEYANLGSSSITKTTPKNTTEKVPLSGHTLFLEFWKKKNGEQVLGSRETRLVKDLLHQTRKTPEALFEIVETARRATDEKRYWNCVRKSRTIPEFVAGYNAITEELKSRSRPRSCL